MAYGVMALLVDCGSPGRSISPRYSQMEYVKLSDAVTATSKAYDCRIGVVVPAYNEEQLIRTTIENIPSYVSSIYVVDDGSTDRTPDIVRGITDSRVELIRHENNKGVGSAITTGYKCSLKDHMDITVVMAGDDQMDPGQLPKLLAPIIEGRADYSKGNRLVDRRNLRGMSALRIFGNILLTMSTRAVSGYWHVTDTQNGYTAISRVALEGIDLDSIYPYYGYCNDILVRLNVLSLRVVDVPMPARYGQEESKIRYGPYVLRVTPMLADRWIWRLKTKYSWGEKPLSRQR